MSGGFRIVFDTLVILTTRAFFGKLALTRTPDPIRPTSLIGASDRGALTWGQMTGWAFDRGAGA